MNKKDIRYNFWFGAGISILAPTSLADGKTFTFQWLKHLLDDDDYAFIFSLFNDNYQIIGKDCPRLEKVIEDSINVYGKEVLNLLKIFKNRQPNQNHINISNYSMSKKCFCFTTNFDNCIELASRNQIPIHLPNHCDDRKWGLVKLHDSILNESLELLGHSIKNLTNGIDSKLKNLLIDCLEDKKNVFVFCGYSGMDSFDITPFFFQFLDNQKFPSSAIWITHNNNSTLEISIDQLDYGPRTILGAFKNVKILSGKTSEIISQFCKEEVINSKPYLDYRKFVFDWNKTFAPTLDDKKKYAAQLFASYGYGKKTFDSIIKTKIKDDYSINLLLNSIRDCGHYKLEIQLRKKYLTRKPFLSREYFYQQRQLAAAYRLNKSYLKALCIYNNLYSNSKIRNSNSEIAKEQVWCLAEYGLFLSDFIKLFPDIMIGKINIGRLPRKLFGSFIRSLYDLSWFEFKEEIKNPHLIATLERLNNLITSLSSGGSTIGYYRRTLRNKIVPDTQSIEIANFMNAENLYIETDSILGKINNLRGQGINLIFQSNNETIKMDVKFRESMKRASILMFERSFKLSSLIQDFPGMIKASKWSNKIKKNQYGKIDLKNIRLQHNRLKKIIEFQIKELNL